MAISPNADAAIRIDLDENDSTPLYQQLAKILREKILSKEFEVGDKLPTEQSLAKSLGIGVSTVRGAYASLVEDGLVTRRAGRGSFVASPKLDLKLGGLYNYSSEMRDIGKTPSSKVLVFSVQSPTKEAADALGIPSSAEVFAIERVRFADDTAVLLERMEIPVDICPNLTEKDVEGSLFEAFRERYGINPVTAREVHEAVVLGSDEAQKLEREVGTPAFRITRTTMNSSGRPIEFNVDLAPGDHTRYVMELGMEKASISAAYRLPATQ